MRKFIFFISNLCEKFIPDAFIFCLLLTLLVFGMALSLTHHPLEDLILFWLKDFWSLNAFTVQMIMVLVSGQVLASTPLVNSFLKLMVNNISKPSTGLFFLTLTSLVFCWINWGLGLMISAILSVEFGRKFKKLNYPLFVSSAYAGFVVWHGGLSGSIPLKIAGKDEVLTKIYPDLSIPISETIFSSYNWLIVLLILILFPILSIFLNKNSSEFEVDLESVSDSRTSLDYFSIEHGPVLTFLIGALFFSGIYLLFSRGGTLDINTMNLIFLSLGIFLHGSPTKFLKSFEHSFKSAAGIAIQFPFYAGLMGIIQYSGLIDLLSELVLKVATPSSLPLLTFLSAGLVNLFVPSGGGQWVVQGPIFLKAAKDIGSNPSQIAMALAWGDAWTNLIQPFWALPILSLAGLRLKDIMGHCLIYLLFSGLIISGVFSFL